jgi:hypothetical protein
MLDAGCVGLGETAETQRHKELSVKKSVQISFIRNIRILFQSPQRTNNLVNGRAADKLHSYNSLRDLVRKVNSEQLRTVCRT